jgi:hypothetical protein
MEYQLGDRIEYWYTTLDDGRTVHKGTITSIWKEALAVREDYTDYPVIIALDDVIRII